MFDTVFSLASTAAIIGWVALILLPRWPMLIAGLRFGLIGALSLTYAVLIFVYFFRIEGGGFGSIAEVRALFLSDGGLVAGWVHYLAFDLFIGTWIAVEADRRGYNRLLQVPMLIGTFMFGPIGLLLFYITRVTEMVLSRKRA
ncbi:DUF4281 domain-containing protein [Ciceribacter sp. L1K23]|uniref:ABA4-like family protein n=1 Tax=Ciceribacter sp. L1K23 TaxID=2820276 RepID=UPI001B81B806|nr:ABA4-like family protein [Ciceribacter sp. L1K23]MBR0556096.1 DUF4281 domain-containing protein [Ciceribacter sp. L1K23]